MPSIRSATAFRWSVWWRWTGEGSIWTNGWAFPSAWQSNARGADPSSAIEEADHKPVAILNHNRPAAYLVPAEAFETLMEALEDAELGEIVRQRRGGKTIKISLDELCVSLSRGSPQRMEKIGGCCESTIQKATCKAPAKSLCAICKMD